MRSNQKKRSRTKQRYQGPDLSGWTAQVEHGLQQTIKMTGYCKEGHIELNCTVLYDRGTIRGECNDGADEAELANFKSYYS
ncbi:hypothetical protein L2719_12030 [Shewanella schlegeliana]|uniref:hypothetical protein n=1 Tax=Shewanella schlegeliana TaxID=190308 RepID=UPI001BBD5114|nr:hypothetical protein [Shewanella schlegeliana]MCL1110276.1 hypothetical protein [Shewanella schlegeliana]GIU35958.1 hypothetical protein TUM4433_34070 [Shewanella schlegeliana]